MRVSWTDSKPNWSMSDLATTIGYRQTRDLKFQSERTSFCLALRVGSKSRSLADGFFNKNFENSKKQKKSEHEVGCNDTQIACLLFTADSSAASRRFMCRQSGFL